MATSETDMQQAQLQKVDAEIAKLIAETAKINKESHWLPVIVAASIIGATIGLVKVLS